MDIKRFQLLYLCSVMPYYFLKHFNKHLSEMIRSSTTIARNYSVEVTVHVQIDLYLLLVKVMIYTRLWQSTDLLSTDMFIIISADFSICLNYKASCMCVRARVLVRAREREGGGSMHAHSHTYGSCPRNMIQGVIYEDMCIFSF
jgi:hypothetical protein